MFEFLKELNMNFIYTWNESSAVLIFCLNPDGNTDDIEDRKEFLKVMNTSARVPKYGIFPVEYKGKTYYYVFINKCSQGCHPNALSLFLRIYGGPVGYYIPALSLYNYKKRKLKRKKKYWCVCYVTPEITEKEDVIEVEVDDFFRSKNVYLRYLTRCVDPEVTISDDPIDVKVDDREEFYTPKCGSGFIAGYWMAVNLGKWLGKAGRGEVRFNVQAITKNSRERVKSQGSSEQRCSGAPPG